MDNNPDPEKLFRILGETGRAIALDDLDDMGDWPINNNTPLPGLTSAPHHGPIGILLMGLAEGGKQAVEVKQQQLHHQQQMSTEHQSDDLVNQLTEALE